VSTAITILMLQDLLAAAMLAGIFSLLCASFFTVMDAVDVAFTEAAVGAGISTLLMLGALSQVNRRERNPKHCQVLPLLVVVLTGAALIYGTLDMPRYGDPNAPIHGHVVPYYIEVGPLETHIPNIVTFTLASHRGYDTMGELSVIFTAGIGVLLLLRRSARRGLGLDSKGRGTS
jgi:multicomponent Na+:H+ antiporter subunit B